MDSDKGDNSEMLIRTPPEEECFGVTEKWIIFTRLF
jgi:hypothetical protein